MHLMQVLVSLRGRCLLELIKELVCVTFNVCVIMYVKRLINIRVWIYGSQLLQVTLASTLIFFLL